MRGHARETALRASAVAHVAHPLAEERRSVGKECARLGEYLRVGRPAQTLVALRTVGGHREVVRKLAPIGVRDEFVYRLVARRDLAYFEALGDGGDGDGGDLLDSHGVGGDDRHVAIAEESAARMIAHELVARAEGVFQETTRIGDAQVLAVHAALGTVHAAASRSVAVVEQLARHAGKRRTLLRAEHERRNARAVLSEIDYQRLARIDGHGLVGSEIL